MTSNRLRLNLAVQDCFLYMNDLYIIDNDNRIGSISLFLIYEKYLKNGSDSYNVAVSSAFVNNREYFESSKYKGDEFRKLFEKGWKEIHNQGGVEIEVDKADIDFFAGFDESYVLNFSLYAKKILITSKSGIYQGTISSTGIFNSKKKLDLVKLHDVQSINVYPKIGDVLFLSKSDGVFRGSFDKNMDSVQMIQNPVLSESNGIGWIDNNVLNYKSDLEVEYIKNDTKKVEDGLDAATNFDVSDDSNSTVRIEKFASEIEDISSKVSANSEKFESTLLSYNTNSFLFLINRAGTIQGHRLADNGDISETFVWANRLNIDKLGGPLSAHIVGRGSVIEFYSSVYSFYRGKVEQIYNSNCLDIKSFTNSRNYRQIVAVINEDYLELHSFNPML